VREFVEGALAGLLLSGGGGGGGGGGGAPPCRYWDGGAGGWLGAPAVVAVAAPACNGTAYFFATMRTPRLAALACALDGRDLHGGAIMARPYLPAKAEGGRDRSPERTARLVRELERRAYEEEARARRERGAPPPPPMDAPPPTAAREVRAAIDRASGRLRARMLQLLPPREDGDDGGGPASVGAPGVGPHSRGTAAAGPLAAAGVRASRTAAPPSPRPRPAQKRAGGAGAAARPPGKTAPPPSKKR
jgi:hypothetical protein